MQCWSIIFKNSMFVYCILELPACFKSRGQCVRQCGTGAFQELGQCLFIGLAARSLWTPTVFPFSSFTLGVGIVGLRSSD